MGEYLRVKGGEELFGRIKLHGAKNAVLPLLALGVLSEDDVTVRDCPCISDVDTMVSLLQDLGLKTERKGRDITVSGRANSVSVQESLCRDMRSSMFMLGALLCACKEVIMPLPGGCTIGARPLDIHFDGLRKMGASVQLKDGKIRCSAQQLKGADIVIKYPSVGATENLLMCASVAQGRTTLINCAREPEIISLAQALRIMGARISGEGSSVMRIEGVKELGGCRITPVGDRIVAGTVLCATALCGGEVSIEGANAYHLQPVIRILQNEDCEIRGDESCLSVRSAGKTHAFNVTTAPYPLFPTDMQAQIFACACFSDGVSSITESVFENRFAHAHEYKKLGADIYLADKRRAIVSGSESPYFNGEELHGADLYARDLRGGAGLLLAAMKIKDESKIFNVEYVDRGYESIENMFSQLGANVSRIIQ